MGYGSRALQALNSFYSGEYFNLDESTKPETQYPDPSAIEPVCLTLANANEYFTGSNLFL